MGSHHTSREKINRIIEEHYGLLGCTAELSEVVLREVGEEGLALVREISSFANEPQHWVYAESHSGAYEEAQRLLREKYPFLSPTAILRIATSAAYGWK